MARQPMTGCWFCGDTTAAGTEYLRSNHGWGVAAEIIVCLPGHGCRDGSIIRHGPGGAPSHPPGQACRECRTDPKMHNDRRPGAQVRDRASRLRTNAGPPPTGKTGERHRAT